jgi:hypothetical protein
MARCLGSAFTTGVPRGTRGALVRYDRSTAMGWNPAVRGRHARSHVLAR